ncbi:MAG TPA: NAD-dependent epimerase/dehydratase family protein [Acidisphaera sp.]|nr:NAD-dependent epimerase/dehydratase family protein [Acidisphaera sp.]
MRVLVTGAAGFVGRHLLSALADTLPPASVIATSLGGERGFVPLDITDAGATDALIAQEKPDACVHLAGVTAVPLARRDPAQAWRVNLDGTLHIARALLAHAPHATLLFVSSADIYGGRFRSGLPLDETAGPEPLNTYAATKAAADLALGAMAAEFGLRSIRVRAFNHIGPGQAPDFALPAFARQIALIEAGQQPPVLRTGDLSPRRDFLDVRDVCRAYALCLQQAANLAPGAVLNLASGTSRRMGDALAALLALARTPISVEPDPALMRPSDIKAAQGDATLARRLLGWEPRIPWEQTLSDVLDDWRRRVAAATPAS